MTWEQRTVAERQAEKDGPPTGHVDGKQLLCPAPVRVVCTFCRLAWWTVVTQVGEPCGMCGAPVVAGETGGES